MKSHGLRMEWEDRDFISTVGLMCVWVWEPNQLEDTQHIQEASETIRFEDNCKWSLLSTGIRKVQSVTSRLQKAAMLKPHWVRDE